MASAATGSFLSELGTGLQKLGPQIAGMKQMEYENVAELAKQHRIESFELMKMGMADQYDRSRMGLGHQYAKEQEKYKVEAESFEKVTKLTIQAWNGASRQVTLKKFKEKNEAGEDIVVWRLLDPDFASRGWQLLPDTTESAVLDATDAERIVTGDGTDGTPQTSGTPRLSTDRLTDALTGSEPTHVIVEYWSRTSEEGFTIGQVIDQMISLLERNPGQFKNITIDDLVELRGKYTKEQLNSVATLETKSPLGPVPSTEEKLSKLESGWLNIASLFTPIGVERALKWSKKIKPWGFLKRSAAGLVVAGVLQVGGRQWLKDQEVSDIPAYFDRQVADYWTEINADQLSTLEQAEMLQILISHPGLELGQDEAVLRFARERGLLNDNETVDQMVARLGGESQPSDVPSLEAPPLSEAAQAWITAYRPFFTMLVMKVRRDGMSALSEDERNEPGLVEAIEHVIGVAPDEPGTGTSRGLIKEPATSVDAELDAKKDEIAAAKADLDVTTEKTNKQIDSIWYDVTKDQAIESGDPEEYLKSQLQFMQSPHRGVKIRDKEERIKVIELLIKELGFTASEQ